MAPVKRNRFIVLKSPNVIGIIYHLVEGHDVSEFFWEQRPNRIESDSGFFVEVLGRTGLRYGEGGQTAFVDSELLAGSAGIYALADSLKQWDSPDGSSIDEPERARILGNIKRAFEFCGHKIQIG